MTHFVCLNQAGCKQLVQRSTVGLLNTVTVLLSVSVFTVGRFLFPRHIQLVLYLEVHTLASIDFFYFLFNLSKLAFSLIMI